MAHRARSSSCASRGPERHIIGMVLEAWVVRSRRPRLYSPFEDIVARRDAPSRSVTLVIPSCDFGALCAADTHRPRVCPARPRMPLTEYASRHVGAVL